jgi:hypothetical protein
VAEGHYRGGGQRPAPGPPSPEQEHVMREVDEWRRRWPPKKRATCAGCGGRWTVQTMSEHLSYWWCFRCSKARRPHDDA